MGLLVSAAAFLGAIDVQAEVDFVATVPAGDEVEAYRHMLERLDGLRFVAVYMAHDPSSGRPNLRSDAGFDSLVFEQQNLTRLLEREFPGVFSHSLSVYEAMRAGHYMFFKVATGGHAPESAYSLPSDATTWSAVRQQVRDRGAVDDVLARDGSSALALFFFATKDHYEARQLAGEVEDVVQAWSADRPDEHPATHQHAATGLLSSSHYVDERNQRELRTWGIASSIAIGLLLWFSFRRVSDVVIAIGALLAAMLWTFGTMGLLGIRISFLTVFLAPLVMGVGIDYAIHILQRFRQERHAGLDPVPAMERAVRTTALAIRLTAATTIAGLSLLLLVPAPLFAQIGGVAALGIALSVVAALTIVPAARVLWPDGRRRRAPRSDLGLLERIGFFAVRRRRFLRAGLGASTLALLLVALLFTRVESGSAENEFPADDPVLKLRQRVEREYGSFQNAYLIIEGDIAQPAAIRALYEASRAAAALPLYHSSASVADLLLADEATDEGAVDILRSRAQPPDESDRLPKTAQEAKERLDQLFRDPLWRSLAPFTITRDYRLAVVVVELVPNEEADRLVALREDLQALRDQMRSTAGPGYEVEAAGAPVNRARVVEQTPKDVALSIVGVAVTTFLLLAIAWGRREGAMGRRVAVVTTALVSSAAVWLLATVPLLDAAYGALHAAGAPANNAALNNMFLLAFALTVAVGADNTIHVVARFWESRRAALPPAGALRQALRHGGAAVTITTATTVLSFSLLAGTYFLQSKNLAILAALGGLYAYVLTLFLLPGFLLRPSDLDVAPT